MFPKRFNRHGLLPPMDYEMSLSELGQSLLIKGSDLTALDWDVTQRRKLASNFGILVEQLWRIGITRIFVDGSFVENESFPHDIDGYFECDKRDFLSGDLERRLNALCPEKIWTWHPNSRRFSDDSPDKAQLPMWHLYHVELYPHYGQGSGILDRLGNELMFPSAFRKDREGRPKGIVRIRPESYLEVPSD
jgi:hypothetical protein